MLRPLLGGVGAILTLHHVRPPRTEAFQPNRLLEVTPQFLEDIIRELRRSETDIVTLDEMHRRLKEQDFRRRFVCLSFDDGYRDILENALPVLQSHGIKAVIFVPVAYMEDETPLPHVALLVERGVRNPTLDWGLMRELDAGGIRVESHGIAHRPLAEVSLDEAVREIAVSKLKLEEQLGRPVRSYAYVKGSEAHYKQVHLSLVRQAGYDVAFTAVSGANSPTSDPLELRRYNVEPYSSRTFELVLAGACDLIAIKDTVTGTRARRVFNAALGTSSK
jgi:peptidoglycan/xylan/chitin deacetylase (PgdA/CDA1 family)